MINVLHWGFNDLQYNLYTTQLTIASYRIAKIFEEQNFDDHLFSIFHKYNLAFHE